MSKKSIAAALLFSFVFALAPAAGGSSAPNFAVSEAGLPAEVEQTGEPLLAAATGGANWSCIGGILGVSFVALGLGAATGGAGLAIVGAYAPTLLVLCR